MKSQVVKNYINEKKCFNLSASGKRDITDWAPQEAYTIWKHTQTDPSPREGKDPRLPFTCLPNWQNQSLLVQLWLYLVLLSYICVQRGRTLNDNCVRSPQKSQHKCQLNSTLAQRASFPWGVSGVVLQFKTTAQLFISTPPALVRTLL